MTMDNESSSLRWLDQRATMHEPHPFARFINILGRGPTLTRSLTIGEAEEAMAMVLAGGVLPEQLGAFLMLLRVKQESPEEVAGFVRAARKTMPHPLSRPVVDLDWSSYAGKKRQLPWYILAALVLARNGWRVLMHGADGHTPGRIYTGEALRHLGLPIAENVDEATAQLANQHFAYLPLQNFSPALAGMIGLRPILGLRSPVHTFARLLNPFGAPAMLQGVFHPNYMNLHRDAGLLLGAKRLAVLRGDGGEFERRPNKPCELLLIVDGNSCEERLEPMFVELPQGPDDGMDLDRLAALWRGDTTSAYAEAAIIGTLAIALRTMGVEEDAARAQARAADLWNARDRDRLAKAA